MLRCSTDWERQGQPLQPAPRIRLRQVREQTVQLLQTLPEPPAIMVGGAVVTPDYAAGLNAAYAKDARQAVEIARKVLG